MYRKECKVTLKNLTIITLFILQACAPLNRENGSSLEAVPQEDSKIPTELHQYVYKCPEMDSQKSIFEPQDRIMFDFREVADRETVHYLLEKISLMYPEQQEGVGVQYVRPDCRFAVNGHAAMPFILYQDGKEHLARGQGLGMYWDLKHDTYSELNMKTKVLRIYPGEPAPSEYFIKTGEKWTFAAGRRIMLDFGDHRTQFKLLRAIHQTEKSHIFSADVFGILGTDKRSSYVNKFLYDMASGNVDSAQEDLSRFCSDFDSCKKLGFLLPKATGKGYLFTEFDPGISVKVYELGARPQKKIFNDIRLSLSTFGSSRVNSAAIIEMTQYYNRILSLLNTFANFSYCHGNPKIENTIQLNDGRFYLLDFDATRKIGESSPITTFRTPETLLRSSDKKNRNVCYRGTDAWHFSMSVLGHITDIDWRKFESDMLRSIGNKNRERQMRDKIKKMLKKGRKHFRWVRRSKEAEIELRSFFSKIEKNLHIDPIKRG